LRLKFGGTEPVIRLQEKNFQEFGRMEEMSAKSDRQRRLTMFSRTIGIVRRKKTIFSILINEAPILVSKIPSALEQSIHLRSISIRPSMQSIDIAQPSILDLSTIVFSFKRYLDTV
jgi:hypothetical protein